MQFQFTPITINYLKEIDSWNYEGFVEDVLMAPYFDSLKESGTLIGPGGCDGFVALLDEKPVGLFEFIVEGSTMEIGLALKPSLVGKGYGISYVRQGIEFGRHYYQETITDIQLVVDEQNKAAIRVYEKVGFTIVERQDNEIKMRIEL